MDVESQLTLINKKLDELLELSRPKEKKKRAAKSLDDLPGFAEFWQAYPRKTCKQQAQKAYRSVNGIRYLKEILHDISLRRVDGRWKDEQYIPYPSTYLNQRRWEDNEDIEQNDVPWNMI